jgi:hypothetical protein
MDKQRDFEKGWEEYKAKKKQEVEEIGQDIADICSDMALNCCGSTPCYACIAKRLERKGYRKIPENAVVLTREEFEFMCVDTKAVREEEVKQARKETAEKFAERLKSMAYQSTDWSHGVHPMVVEVDYIDEICEEFTEGSYGKN